MKYFAALNNPKRIISAVLASLVLGALVGVAAPSFGAANNPGLAYAAASPVTPTPTAAPARCDSNFFGLVTWYHYLGFTKDSGGGCSSNLDFINSPSDLTKLWLIGFAIFQDLLRIAGAVAVGFVIYGGIQYLVSQGQSERTSKAFQTILNALKGLVAVIIAVPSVNFIADKLGGTTDNSPTGTGLPNVAATSSTLAGLLSIIFGIIGGVALLMVTIGGYRYITSQGDPQATAQAKNTILYALVGVAVSALAVTIVQFVFNRA